ncbi:Protein trichome birefringence-like 31 [Ranunculus cassubicifolius]
MAILPSSSGRRIALSFFPLALASLLLIGTVRLVLENSSHSVKTKSHFPTTIVSSNWSRCNIFDGKWVFDNTSRPLYKEENCPILAKQVTCQGNGRPDSLYQNWRWEPNGCTLPRFNANKILEILRNKRMMFVGDSIQRSQFQSMVCLVQSVIPQSKMSIHRSPAMKIFKAEEYNATIMFYWAPFIVESNSDHAVKHSVQKRLVKLDSIEKHSRHWNGIDVLVFESYVWWMYEPIINVTNGPPYVVEEYNVTTAYELALRTWANWIDSNINPQAQKIFFTSSSPTHLWRREWKAGGEGNCFGELEPIQGSYWGSGSSLDIMRILANVIQEMKIDVTVLNITQLSEYRKDGHTSVYTERRGKLLTSEERADPKTTADCIHWCLPGVPDTWNEILYSHLLHSS